MTFFNKVFSVLATRIAVIPIALATQVVLARLLSVEERGFYAIAVEFAALGVSAVQLGWPQATIHRLRSARTAPAIVATAALLACGAMVAIAAGVCFAFEGPLREGLLPGAPGAIFGIAVAMLLVQLIQNVFSGIARGLDRFSLDNAFQLAEPVITLVGLAAALLLYRSSATAALLVVLCVRAALAIALTTIVVGLTGVTASVRRDEIGPTLRFGLKSHVQAVLASIHQRIDVFLLIWLSKDPEQVAVYAVAVAVANRVRLIPSSIARALYPTASGLGAADAGRLSARVLSHSIFWVALSVLVLAPASFFLVPVFFGERYQASVGPLLLLLPATGFFTIQVVLGRYFLARDHQAVNLFCYGSGALLNVLLNLWWIPEHGVLGAAGASLASYGAQALLILWMFTQASGERLRDSLLVPIADLKLYWLRIGERILPAPSD